MADTLQRFVLQGDPQRLDKYLVTCLPEFTRSRLQDLIADGRVTVNGKTAGKSGVMVEDGQVVEISIPPVAPSNLTPEAIALDVVFENDDLMIINKPAGMVVHPSIGHSTGTLVHAALAHAPELEGVGGEQRPGVVHRLDKDTSGLILLAKNDRAHQWLQNQFKQRKVKKIYRALVDGAPPTPSGRVEAPIDRDSAHRKRMAVVPPGKGREAVTEYFTEQRFNQHTLVECHPFTGRTHQIRLHMAFLGCPIVGDTLYGHRKPTLEIQRHFLHAQRISIVLPGETQARTFEAPLPEDLQRVLDELNR